MSKNFTKELRLEIGRQLKDVRLAKGLTPAQVALDAELSTEQILQIEKCSNLSVKKYRALARYYGEHIKLFLAD